MRPLNAKQNKIRKKFAAPIERGRVVGRVAGYPLDLRWQAKSRPKNKIKRHHKSTRRLSSDDDDDDDDDAGSGSCHGDRQKESVECEVNMKQKNSRNKESEGGVGIKLTRQ